MPLSFGGAAQGETLGSGVVLVLDESIDLGDILVRIAASSATSRVVSASLAVWAPCARKSSCSGFVGPANRWSSR